MRVTTLILGAGAAGLMCAAQAGSDTLLVDHAKQAGDKIRISGGGRCNFTNLDVSAANFISANPHFCKSALARYTPWDFIELMGKYGLTYTEKTLGQLFCDQKSGAIIQMLVDEAAKAGATLWLETEILSVEKSARGYAVTVKKNTQTIQILAQNLVVATGGKSIPKMGATGLGYTLAQQFGLPLIDPFPGLVPFTFSGEVRDAMAARSGLSLDAVASVPANAFREGMLFTHRGLSGPSLLQISSYWVPGTALSLDFSPGQSARQHLHQKRQERANQSLAKALADFMPSKLMEFLFPAPVLARALQTFCRTELEDLADAIHACTLLPAGTEGYRTAEVTVGGVDTISLSSRTMEVRDHPGLYFIGEVVDVTGWLGGYNFQWAWASAVAAGQAISTK